MGDLRSAVEAQLEAMGTSPAPGMSAMALAMADALEHKPSAMMFTELRQTLESLHKIAPPKRAEDGIDELNKRRRARRAG